MDFQAAHAALVCRTTVTSRRDPADARCAQFNQRAVLPSVDGAILCGFSGFLGFSLCQIRVLLQLDR